jgi:hypothetical protein
MLPDNQPKIGSKRTIPSRIDRVFWGELPIHISDHA